MKTIFLILSIGLLSFGLKKKMPLSKKASSENLEVLVQVTKNQKRHNRYLGSIEIENRTTRVIKFNFNQKLIIGKDTLSANYNFRPISWAAEAFIVDPHQTVKWNVVWESTREQNPNDDIVILIDSSTLESNK